ncbi:hypothetical protein HK103_005337 [Boothiomyces macroporosus]|uniref:Uncharacterized protein n=1 Tax=Boothiomyces macroporosus TaxID=261099 RepID=A0AAD5Y614_9FUNG|nr:hypothetical protein HK103_005337 [Boothiomyces macroporosus]
MTLFKNSRHVYLSGETQISVNIVPEIVFSRKEPAFFEFQINSNTCGSFSFRLIGTETVINKKAEKHMFLDRKYKINLVENNQQLRQLISPEGLLCSVKLKNASIKYKVEFYFNKINICTAKLAVITPSVFKHNLLMNHQLFANPSNLLFSVEGSRILFIHSEEDIQFLISPFRPKLVIVGSQKITKISFSLVEETGFKVRYRPHSWDPAMNVVKKDERKLLEIDLLPEEFDIKEGTVCVPLEILQLEGFVEPDVKGNYISIRHSLVVNVHVVDGHKYSLHTPVQVISK